jgi:hypothetical protein
MGASPALAVLRRRRPHDPIATTPPILTDTSFLALATSGHFPASMLESHG